MGSVLACQQRAKGPDSILSSIGVLPIPQLGKVFLAPALLLYTIRQGSEDSQIRLAAPVFVFQVSSFQVVVGFFVLSIYMISSCIGLAITSFRIPGLAYSTKS